MAALLRGLARNLRDNLQRFVLPEARPTGRSLGTGSYGSVEEVEVNGMICAGKKIHEALLDAGNFGVQVLARKYVEECQLMTEMRHPHVVQFIGICFRAESPLPLLVMERLEMSLDDLLETTPDIPLTIKRSVLEGTARGLLYLHQRVPPVIHRDLTAKNILLTSSFEAKITDFGNSRMVDIQPGRLGTLSRLPGTLVYMPPEALEDRARYGPSLDVFSFGHCALFTCTQVFPGDLKSSTYPDPANSEHTLARSEVQRREDYLSQLEQLLLGGSRHPMVALVRQCLHNAPDRRPTTEGLVEQLVGMRAAIEGPYGDMIAKLDVARVGMTRAMRSRETQVRELQQQMAQLETDTEARVEGQAAELRERNTQVTTLQRQVREKDGQIRTKDEEIRAKDGQIQVHAQGIRLKNDQIHTKNAEIQAKDEELRTKDGQIRAKDAELNSKDDRMRASAAELQQLRRSCDSLRAELASRDERLRQQGAELESLSARLRELQTSPRRKPLPVVGLKLPLRLKWKGCRDMPFRMSGNPYSVLLRRKLYVGGGLTGVYKDSNEQTVIVYDLDSDEWSKLRKYQFRYFGMAVVSGKLVLIGGRDPDNQKTTNQLAVWDEDSQCWTHPYHAMQTACYSPAVAAYNHYLIVAGGGGDGGSKLTRVEVLDTRTNRWYNGASLPEGCAQMTSAIVGDMWYLMGGFTESVPTKVVFRASLSALSSAAVSQSASVAAPVWSTLTEAPLKYSHALSLQGSLLAVGGWDDRGKASSAIHHYHNQADTENWVKVGQLPTARRSCACAALPSGGFLVAGGWPGWVGTGSLSRVDMATTVDN